MMTRRALLLAASGAAAGSTQLPSSAALWDPRKRMLLDTRVVERNEGLRLALGAVRKESRNPLFVEDKPWEVRIDNLYGNVLYDAGERIYKCWYCPFIRFGPHDAVPRDQRAWVDYSKLSRRDKEMAICYATSPDGIRWEKPELGLEEFRGSKRNNILARAHPAPSEWIPHGAGINKDPSDADPERRYKMILAKTRHCLCVSFSRDGIHWREPIPLPEPQVRGDTHNNAFRAPELNRWVAFSRRFDGTRIVTRTESRDFLHWSAGTDIMRSLPSEPARQTYALIGFPYGSVYLGMVMVLNRSEKPNAADPDNDTVDCELAWSADTLHWERLCPGTPLIPRGPRGSCDWGCVYGCPYPLLRDNQLRIYYGGSNGRHTDWRDGSLCLAYLRPDGFAGLEPERKGGSGSVLTTPLRMQTEQLQVSADVEEGGSVSVSVLHDSGRTIARSEPLKAGAIDEAVRWTALWTPPDHPVRLRFEVAGARLYSFRTP